MVAIIVLVTPLGLNAVKIAQVRYLYDIGPSDNENNQEIMNKQDPRLQGRAPGFRGGVTGKGQNRDKTETR